ncbi:MAG: DNA mismatch repair endonuclease MutL [Desulfobacterales bacterium]|nr:DNA mismatch repair endonuclease MutL [Desulfobacterales bacterium]
MARIRILPEILSNKIAAGEVVERPASVVKELVENAIDAGADRIGVEIEKGGRRLVRVADNGSGMHRDDALLALERYATSKIRNDADLFAIQTLGFRGEALPSIASVSRFILATRRPEDDAGTEIRVTGGKIESVREAGMPPGTMVTVRDLFFNTPARRKFMKTVATEMGHIGDGLASQALGHPQIHFELRHNGRPLRRWPAAEDPAERVAAVLGADLRQALVALDLETEAVRVSGWAAAPRVNRRSSRGVHIFVNGRHVRDRTVLHAVLHGYRERLMKGQYPVAVCRLAVPVSEVDVNVHPAKYEVRFVRQQAVHGAVAGAVHAALTSGEQASRASAARSFEHPPATSSPHGVAEINPAFGRPFTRTTPETVARAGAGEVSAVPADMGTRPPSPQPSLWSGGAFARLKIIGQFRNTYILCESEAGLVLIDQHAAHERVFYEQLLKRARSQNAAAQALLIPETLELDFRAAATLETMRDGFKRVGLDIEPFGGNAFVIRSAPDFLGQVELGPMIREIVEQAEAAGVKPDPEALWEASLQVMACHGAIRAHQALDERQIRRLLAQLDECDNPAHCPHGRPTWIRWTTDALARAFGRSS